VASSEHEELGLGDAKLLAALGPWFGWHTLPNTLLSASWLGLIFVLVRFFWNHQTSVKIAFGPFLLIGALISLGLS
tara:strand:- start:10918 stop:11145 length:228 start_codon:yes stop_codon:yes gene_type:complete